MAIFNRKIIFFLMCLLGNFAMADVDLRGIYPCLNQPGLRYYWADLQEQILSLEKAKSNRLPKFELEVAKESQLLDSAASKAAYGRVGLAQTIYDKAINREIEVADSSVAVTKWSQVQTLQEETKKILTVVLDYYELKRRYEILEQKIRRQSNLISVLRDLVRSRATDGVLLVLSENDLKLSEVRRRELKLQIQRIEKGFFVNEKVRNFIIDGSFWKAATKLVSKKSYSKQVDKTKTMFYEAQKKYIFSKSMENSDVLFPKISLGLDYYSYLEKSMGEKPKDEFIFSLSLTIPFSDLYWTRSYQKNQTRQLEYNGILAEKEKFSQKNNDQFNVERLNQINQTLKDFEVIKLNTDRAKDVISKKLFINKSSYNDYVLIDDRFDEIETLIYTNELERVKLLLFNDLDEFYSNDGDKDRISCLIE